MTSQEEIKDKLKTFENDSDSQIGIHIELTAKTWDRLLNILQDISDREEYGYTEGLDDLIACIYTNLAIKGYYGLEEAMEHMETHAGFLNVSWTSDAE
jgi:hypothetical protein